MKLRALLYLRKSTDEHQADSIDTQRHGALRLLAKLGGEVVHEIIDEGESRAEFKRRPGWTKMLAMCAAKSRDFDIIVVRDESRLGAGARLTVALDDILAAGVRVFYYATGQEVQLDSAEQKIMTAIKSAMAENERAKTAERTREALERKARSGLNAGGKCYGYDNVRTTAADGKAFTTYKINPKEAAVVLDICQRYAAGDSERTIAHDLNARAVPPPRAGKRGTGSWSPSCVREMIRRPRYRGCIEWGKVGAEYRGGTRVTFDRKAVDVITFEAPELRIVPEALDEVIQERIGALKKRTGMSNYQGRVPKYLLSGKALSRCAVCGGPMQVCNSKQGQRIIKVYTCSWHRDRGPDVCTNNIQRSTAVVDTTIIDWLRADVLTERVVAAVISGLREKFANGSESSGSEVDNARTEIEKLDREIKRLVTVAASLDEDDKPAELAKQLEDRTRRRRELRARLDILKAAPAVLTAELGRLEEEVYEHFQLMRERLTSTPAEARRAVEMLFKDPLTFTPTRRNGVPQFELTGHAVTGGFLSLINPSDPDGNRRLLSEGYQHDGEFIRVPDLAA